jgi:hypothetical protein
MGLLGAISFYAVKQGLRSDNPCRGVQRHADGKGAPAGGNRASARRVAMPPPQLFRLGALFTLLPLKTNIFRCNKWAIIDESKCITAVGARVDVGRGRRNRSIRSWVGGRRVGNNDPARACWPQRQIALAARLVCAPICLVYPRR